MLKSGITSGMQKWSHIDVADSGQPDGLRVKPMACLCRPFLKPVHFLSADLMAFTWRSFLTRNNVPRRRSLILVVSKKIGCLCVQCRSSCPIYYYHHLSSYSFPIIPIYLSSSIILLYGYLNTQVRVPFNYSRSVNFTLFIRLSLFFDSENNSDLLFIYPPYYLYCYTSLSRYSPFVDSASVLLEYWDINTFSRGTPSHRQENHPNISKSYYHNATRQPQNDTNNDEIHPNQVFNSSWQLARTRKIKWWEIKGGKHWILRLLQVCIIMTSEKE